MSRLLLFVLIPVVLVAQTTAQQQPYGSVDGRVTNAQTSDAISGATLHLYPLIHRGAGSQQAQASTSQADGSFQFEAVAPGTYFVSVEDAGFVATSFNGPPQSISVASGQQVTNIAVQLNPQAVVSGKVLDEKGDLAPGARLEAFTKYTVRGKAQLRRVSSTTANKVGEYALKNLPSGTYYLAAEPPDRSKEAQTKEPAAKNPDPSGLELVRTFYPQALDFESATPFEIAAGQNLTGTDIHLRRMATYHIRGKIDVPIAGNPSRSWTIYLARRNSLGSDAGARIERPNTDGTFDIDKVIQGSYTLTLTGVDSSNSTQSARISSRTRLLARQDIEIGADDVNRLILSVIPPIGLIGHVVLEGSDNPNLSQVRVSLTPAGATAVGGFQSVAVKSDGTFAVDSLDPGEYAVRISGGPPGTYVKSISFNRQDITTAGLDILQGGAGEIDIVLRSGAGEVDGTVQPGEADQIPAGAAAGPISGNGATMVLLVPEVLALDGSGTLFGSAPPQSSFTIRNVPPGRYYAFAVEQWSSVWQNPDFLREMQSAGTSVDVQEYGHMQIQLPITTVEQVQQVVAKLGLTLQ